MRPARSTICSWMMLQGGHTVKLLANLHELPIVTIVLDGST